MPMRKHESGPATDMAVEISQWGAPDQTPLAMASVSCRLAWISWPGNRDAMPVSVSHIGPEDRGNDSSKPSSAAPGELQGWNLSQCR